MRPTAIARLLLFGLFLSIPSVPAHAQCITYTGECLLPPDCTFPLHSSNFFGVTYGALGQVGTLNLSDESPCMPYPPLGGSANVTFDAHADVYLSTDGGATSHDYSETAHMTAHYATISDDGTNKSVNAEILAMDVSGGTFPAGVLLRESPTLASVGPLASEAWESGRAMHAALDVFTELSLDNGQTWTPASGALHMMYYESTPVKVTTWGSAKAIYR